MTEDLPITIHINSELQEMFSTIIPVCNKLAAQFNFQTLTANWYGDEEYILSIALALETPVSFSQQHDSLQSVNGNKQTIKKFSDDVFYTMNDEKQQLHCYISMTTSELELLELQPKVLTGLIQTKLHKILNLIAQAQSFPQI